MLGLQSQSRLKTTNSSNNNFANIMETKRPLVRSLGAAVLALLACTMAHAADYQSTVLSDGPKAYYRLNDDTSRVLINQNSGSLGAAGNATNDLTGVVHSFPGAIAGDSDRSAFFDFTTRTEIPFNPALNPPNTQPFTIEAWLYPASDQTGNGMSPLANRWAQGGNRQGWVFYQRRPDESYNGTEPVGWACRMYNDLDTSGHLEARSGVPYRVGEWQHVVVVYDPVGGDPLNATLTMYINGVPADTSINTSGVPGYAPVTGDHDPAPNGQPAMALGNYNNANSSLNPWFGAVDEFALYSNKLSPEQILAHYQNGTNAQRATSYEALVKSHDPVVYLRLNERTPSTDMAVNLGDTRAAGLASHTAGVRHPAPSALAGRAEDGAVAYHNRNGNSTTTIPYLAENNPNAGVPFTFEAWLRPMRDQQGGQCPVNNRWPKLGHRTGWVIFQRFPNASYANVPGINNEGHGWCFRMYDGASGSGYDVLTGYLNLTPDDPLYHAGDYTIGKWQHLVVTWEPQFDYGDPGGTGNNQWQGVLTAYVDGAPVASNTAALYAANMNPPEDGGTPADLAIGSYNEASTLGNNPFEGDVDEVAFYNGFVLTPEQILAHYQAGMDSSYGTNYETLVFTAGLNTQLTPGAERTGLPTTYLRFNEPAFSPAANSGTVGQAADGALVQTVNVIAGPQPPTYAGFEPSNTGLPLDGSTQWAGLNSAPGLNVSGQITLEAWVKPGVAQGDSARIISHGPPTLTDYIVAPPENALTNSSEVFLRIDGAGATYVVGASMAIYTNNVEFETSTYAASFDVPAGDLGGSDWIHLVGTYDGANWKLYRNGVRVATSAAAVGALPVTGGDWAIGSTGNGWANNFAGDVDEVAIYDTALSDSRIATHYLMGKAGTTALTILKSGANVTIAWPSGTTLQQSTTLTGTYEDVPGSPSSPLTIPASGTKFYRWRL